MCVIDVTIRCSYVSAPLREQFQKLVTTLMPSSPSPRPLLEIPRGPMIFVERTEVFFWTADPPSPPDNARFMDAA